MREYDLAAHMEDRIEQAKAAYERAVFGGDDSALAAASQDLDALEADLAVARGRLIHARCLQRMNEGQEAPAEADEELALFERAARLYRVLGDSRAEGEALFWVGVFHQVVRGDNDVAVPTLERSRALAAQAGDAMTVSYALRHLGIAEHGAGRFDAAREHLEESTRIRRELEFAPGVAANLVGLAYIAAGDGREHDVSALLDQAAVLAGGSAPGILRQVEEARGRLLRRVDVQPGDELPSA
jgi:tetratricopeptide (TPR) repeat protein